MKADVYVGGWDGRLKDVNLQQTGVLDCEVINMFY